MNQKWIVSIKILKFQGEQREQAENYGCWSG
jgi:hypothetical protein